MSKQVHVIITERIESHKGNVQTDGIENKRMEGVNHAIRKTVPGGMSQFML